MIQFIQDNPIFSYIVNRIRSQTENSLLEYKLKKRELWRAYENADYLVNETDSLFTLKIGKKNYQLEQILKKHQASNWAFVTAHNPHSNKLSKKDNLNRHQKLISYCETQNYNYYSGQGIDKSGDWEPENSLLIIGIDVEKAKNLGQHFQQNAIVCGSVDEPAFLVSCR